MPLPTACIFDLDGVLYHGNTPTPHAAELIQQVQQHRVPHLLLTNHSGKTRQQVQHKLQGMGMRFPLEHILTSGFATALHLTAQHMCTRMHVASGPALLQEIQEQLPGFQNAPVEEAELLVLGHHTDYTHDSLTRLARQMGRGVPMIATNRDRLLPEPAGTGFELGPVVAWLEVASGQPVTVLGKPHPLVFELALQRLGTSGAVMVGDTLDTDITGALQAGLKAIWLHNGPEQPPAGCSRVSSLLELQRMWFAPAFDTCLDQVSG